MKKLLALCLLPLSFCLSQQQVPWSDAGTWAFHPGQDPYTDNTLFDLRPLLDKVAGEKGFIKLGDDGGFVRGDGSPIRFWANTAGTFDGNQAAAETYAKNMSKRGVNLVRLFVRQLNDNLDNPEADAKKIAEIQMAVATYKKHGMYSIINIYWHSDAILFLSPKRQAAYKNWWRELLTRPNPFCPDKKPLKDDPAVAILQIQNEDSLLFWTFMGIREPQNKELFDPFNAKFKEWQKKNNLPDAELNYAFWEISHGDPDHSRNPSENIRQSMRFAAEYMREFNIGVAKFLREDIGCPALINAGNWQTADQVRLLDLERWSYDANDVIGVNRYVDMSGHHNPHGRVGWLVERGDTYRNVSCLKDNNWRFLPTNTKQVRGKPTIVPETGWVAPNGMQAEAPFLVAAYMSLSGVGACFWSGFGSTGFDIPSWPFHNGVYKWGNHACPEVMGGWPATAWMYHKGYLKRGEISVDEKRGLEGDLWDLKVPVIAEDSNFDPNRPGTSRAQSNIVGGAPHAAFMIGRAQTEYGKNPADSKVNLHGNTPEDIARGLIKSSTGEILMDTPRGVCVIDAPCAQGACGFLASAETIKTSALTLDIFNEYGAVLAVSLDEKPLAQSKKILLQITTQSRPDGWADEPATHDGKEVLRIKNTGGGGAHNVGKPHFNVKNTSGLFAIKNPLLTKATLADPNFYPAGDVPVKRRGESLEIKLPPNAMYIVLE